MPLSKYVFKPGINKEGTNYSNEGGWFDADKVRFRKGRPERIGGWLKQSIASFIGTCRKIFVYRASSGMFPPYEPRLLMALFFLLLMAALL